MSPDQKHQLQLNAVREAAEGLAKALNDAKALTQDFEEDEDLQEFTFDGQCDFSYENIDGVLAWVSFDGDLWVAGHQEHK